MPVMFVRLTPKAKGKSHPRTNLEAPDWEQRYNSTLPVTSPLDRGEWWTLGSVWAGAGNLATIGFRSPYRPALRIVAIPTSLSQPTSVVPKNETSQRTLFQNVCTALQHTATHVLVRNCTVELSLSLSLSLSLCLIGIFRNAR